MGSDFDAISAINTKYPELKKKGWVDFNKNNKMDPNETLNVNDNKINEADYYRFIGNNRASIDRKIIDSAVSSLINILNANYFLERWDETRFFIKSTAKFGLEALEDKLKIKPKIKWKEEEDPDNSSAAWRRVGAATSLGWIKDRAAVPALIKALCYDTSIKVRGTAAWALGEIKDPAALPALKKCLENDAPAYGTGELDSSNELWFDINGAIMKIEGKYPE